MLTPEVPTVGLCARCRHARIVVNARGSRFWLCTAAATTPGLPKYPPLPVLRCPVFEPGTPIDPGEGDRRS